MLELPDIVVYTEALTTRIAGQTLTGIRLLNPFLLRTAVPPIDSALGRKVTGVSRLGKRIVLALEDDLFIVLHLMIAGRLRWLAKGAKPPGRITQAVFDFPNGQLAFTEAGMSTRKTRPTIARAARPAASCSRIGRYRDCSRTAGRARSMSWDDRESSCSATALRFNRLRNRLRHAEPTIRRRSAALRTPAPAPAPPHWSQPRANT